MKGLPEDRAITFAKHIIDTGATVRETAKRFDISKSTVQIVSMEKDSLLQCSHILFYHIRDGDNSEVKRTCFGGLQILGGEAHCAAWLHTPDGIVAQYNW